MAVETGSPFETRLAAIFQATEAAVAERLAREKAKADALQAQDTSRFAYTLTDAIEHELQPAVEKALASYDEAIDRPITPNPKWEDALRTRIGRAVDAAVRQATAQAHHGPWRPLLEQEAPKLRERLLALAEDHFHKLGKARKARKRASGGAVEAAIRAGLFVAGLVVGGLLMRLVGG